VGTVRRPLAEFESAFGYGDEVYRDIEVNSGKVRMYWVRFDTPQFDLEGEGPFFEAEIAEEELSLCE